MSSQNLSSGKNKLKTVDALAYQEYQNPEDQRLMRVSKDDIEHLKTSSLGYNFANALYRTGQDKVGTVSRNPSFYESDRFQGYEVNDSEL